MSTFIVCMTFADTHDKIVQDLLDSSNNKDIVAIKEDLRGAASNKIT